MDILDLVQIIFFAAFIYFSFESGVEQSKYTDCLVNRMRKFMAIKLDIPLCCTIYPISITERPITLTNVGNKKTTTIICNIEIVDFCFCFLLTLRLRIRSMNMNLAINHLDLLLLTIFTGKTICIGIGPFVSCNVFHGVTGAITIA